MVCGKVYVALESPLADLADLRREILAHDLILHPKELIVGVILKDILLN